MNQQPEALRLAEAIKQGDCSRRDRMEAAKELERLYQQNRSMHEFLAKAIYTSENHKTGAAS